MEHYLDLATKAVPIVGLALALWVSHRISRAADHQAEAHRAVTLSAIASDAAALVSTLVPAATPVAHLIEQTVAEMSGAAGLPTTNPKAIERAAAGAVAELKRPANGA